MKRERSEGEERSAESQVRDKKMRVAVSPHPRRTGKRNKTKSPKGEEGKKKCIKKRKEKEGKVSEG